MLKGTFIGDSFVVKVQGKTYSGTFDDDLENAYIPGMNTDLLRMNGGTVSRYDGNGKVSSGLVDREKLVQFHGSLEELESQILIHHGSYIEKNETVIHVDADGQPLKEANPFEICQDDDGNIFLTQVTHSKVYTKMSGMEKVDEELTVVYRLVNVFLSDYKEREAEMVALESSDPEMGRNKYSKKSSRRKITIVNKEGKVIDPVQSKAEDTGYDADGNPVTSSSEAGNADAGENKEAGNAKGGVSGGAQEVTIELDKPEYVINTGMMVKIHNLTKELIKDMLLLVIHEKGSEKRVREEYCSFYEPGTNNKSIFLWGVEDKVYELDLYSKAGNTETLLTKAEFKVIN